MTAWFDLLDLNDCPALAQRTTAGILLHCIFGNRPRVLDHGVAFSTKSIEWRIDHGAWKNALLVGMLRLLVGLMRSVTVALGLTSHTLRLSRTPSLHYDIHSALLS